MVIVSVIQGPLGVVQGTFGVILMMFIISILANLGCRRSLRGAGRRNIQTADAYLRGLLGGVSNPPYS